MRTQPHTLPEGIFVLEVTKVKKRGKTIITQAQVICPTCHHPLRTLRELGRAGLVPALRKRAA